MKLSSELYNPNKRSQIIAEELVRDKNLYLQAVAFEKALFYTRGKIENIFWRELYIYLQENGVYCFLLDAHGEKIATYDIANEPYCALLISYQTEIHCYEDGLSCIIHNKKFKDRVVKNLAQYRVKYDEEYQYWTFNLNTQINLLDYESCAQIFEKEFFHKLVSEIKFITTKLQ